MRSATTTLRQTTPADAPLLYRLYACTRDAELGPGRVEDVVHVPCEVAADAVEAGSATVLAKELLQAVSVLLDFQADPVDAVGKSDEREAGGGFPQQPIAGGGGSLRQGQIVENMADGVARSDGPASKLA